LTRLALAGTKTTTAGLFAEMEADGEAVTGAGSSSPARFGGAPGRGDRNDREPGRPTRRRRRSPRDREERGYANAAEFREAHERFWNGYLDELRATLGDPGFTIGDDTLVVLQRFRVVERIDPD
jgi:uncharacterized protein YhfF